MSFVRKDRRVVTGQNGDLISTHLGDQNIPAGRVDHVSRRCHSFAKDSHTKVWIRHKQRGILRDRRDNRWLSS